MTKTQRNPREWSPVIALGLATLVGTLGLAGCSTAGGVASDLGLAGAGGVAGYELSGGKVGGAAAGAAAGYLASKVAQAEVRRAINEAEQRGYDRAMSQAVKQQYWIIQNQQRSLETREPVSSRLVPVKIPESTIDGVIQNASIEYLRAER